MQQGLKRRTRGASPFLTVTVHPGGVYEVVDRIKGNCGHVWSHLLIGKPDAVDAVAEALTKKHADAYLVCAYGQGEGDTENWERVLHRPAA